MSIRIPYFSSLKFLIHCVSTRITLLFEMATQIDGASPDVSAQVVGNAFVNQFYSMFHDDPDMVYKFFVDSSFMTRPGSDGVMTTVTTMKGINDLILSFNCKKYTPTIFTADAQSSHVNGVSVLVTGCLTGQDNVRRKFTESFFLAPQERGYFVLNNVFRFLEDDSLPQVNSVEKEYDTNDASAAPVTGAQGTDEIPDNSFENDVVVPVAEVVIENSIEINDPSKNQPKETVVETTIPQAPVASVESSRSSQPVVEALSNGYVDASKKSYASLLKGMNSGAIATLVRTPTITTEVATAKIVQKSVASSAVQHSGIETVPATASESSASNGRNNSTNSTDQAEENGYSIYIGDLPWNATIELVEQEFKKFGSIKRNGIQVRSNKGYCFGFVEYEDTSAQQKAIEMGTIQIEGKEVFIEEKKTATRVVNGVSTYTSGRGGFRNDGYRGRGSGYRGRGYARNDFNKRSGEAPRSYNKNGSGAGHQNGGRGARQGGLPKEI